MAPELVDIAVTDPDRFDSKHGAAGPELGPWDLAELPGLITVEHDGARAFEPPGLTETGLPGARPTSQTSLASARELLP